MPGNYAVRRIAPSQALVTIPAQSALATSALHTQRVAARLLAVLA